MMLTNQKDEPMSDLITIENVTPSQLFIEGGLDTVIEKIETEARKHAPDISTKESRGKIISLSKKVCDSKTAIEKLGKELVSEWKAKSKKVDMERSRAWDRLDALQKEIRQPVTDWENKDKNRIAEHEAEIANILALGAARDDQTAESITENINALQRWHNRDWEEYSFRFKSVIEEVKNTLEARLAVALKVKADRIELERLKQAEAARIKKEHEDKLKAEAAEKSRIEAEAKARKAADQEAARVKLEQEKADRERIRIEKEKQEALALAAKAQADRIAVEEKAKADAKAAAEQAKQAEIARIAAEEKAKSDAIAAAAEAERIAKEREVAAAGRERARLEEEAKIVTAETARREADKAHRAKINNEILAAVSAFTGEDISETKSSARNIVEALAKGEIPHTKISY